MDFIFQNLCLALCTSFCVFLPFLFLLNLLFSLQSNGYMDTISLIWLKFHPNKSFHFNAINCFTVSYRVKYTHINQTFLQTYHKKIFLFFYNLLTTNQLISCQISQFFDKSIHKSQHFLSFWNFFHYTLIFSLILFCNTFCTHFTACMYIYHISLSEKTNR